MIKVKSFINRAHSKVKQHAENVLFDHMDKSKFINVGLDPKTIFSNNPSAENFPVRSEPPDIIISYLTGQWGKIQIDAAPHLDLSGNIDEKIKMLEEYKNTSKLYITDILSPHTYSKYPEWITDKDFIQGYERAPEHPNQLTPSGKADDRLFYVTGRTPRIPKTAALMIQDGANHDLLPIIFSEMDLTLVLGKHDFKQLPNWETYQSFAKKIICHSYEESTWHLMRQVLNSVEFTINLYESGYEYLTIEGAFCGAQPIYPGVKHFKEDVFGNVEDAGILYYDVSVPDDSLKDLLNQRSTWGAENIEALRQHHGASITVPRMWDELYTKYNSKKYQEKL